MAISNFGKKIREIRKNKHLSQGQVSLYSGVSRAYISQIESGDRGTPQPKLIVKLAKGLRVNPQILYKAAGIIPDDNEVINTEGKILNLDELVTDDDIKLAFDGKEIADDDKEMIKAVLKQAIKKQQKKFDERLGDE